MYKLKAFEDGPSGSWRNPANFEALVLECQPRIYNFLYRLLRDRPLAQDLTQETFLRAYRALCKHTGSGTGTGDGPGENEPVLALEKAHSQSRPLTLEGNSSIVPWLYTIARNAAISELRRRKSVQFFSLRYTDDNSLELELNISPIFELIGGASEIENHVVLRDELEVALAKVGKARLAALLLHLDGFTYEEISDLTNISLSGVKSRIFRAKQDLRRTLGERPELVA